jgi:hypothetical protein
MSNEREAIEGEILRDKWKVERILGEGALGRTMLAHDVNDPEHRVAIKELLPSRMKRWKDFDLFHRECRTLQGLEHPGIPSYHEDFEIEPDDPSEPSRLFLVQEFVEGASLQDSLDEGHLFDEAEVRDILRQTLEILGYLHERNPPVIHRDIKPANLMRTKDGRIVIIDFGAVREAITFDGLGSTIVGTFGYMPPEQYAGASGPPTDIFAIGASCVQLLTGTPPGELFEGIHSFKLPNDLPVTLGFERILLKMTEPEVGRRYQSAQEVLDDLDRGFLMVPKEAVTGTLPIPYAIRPAPRNFPGFYLRDAYHGMSHMMVVILSITFVLLVCVFPITVIVTGSPVWAIPGGLAVASAGAIAAAVSRKARTEIGVFRRGTYTLGEITGRFLSTSADHATNLTYRYRVGDRFEHGCISTRDKGYRMLTPGDPIGVLYLPDETSEHVLYAVPSDFSKKQTEGLDVRLLES